MGPDTVCPALLTELRDDLGYRRIGQGIQRLERLRPVVEALRPEAAQAGILVGLIAQWVDAGFDCPAFLSRLLLKFPVSVRPRLPLLDYLHLRMAEGALAMSQEEFDRAEAHLQFVCSLEAEVHDDELFAIANFWMGRCLRRTGQYDDALAYTQRGEELALACGYAPMAAIMQTTTSWLAFQKGRLADATAMLQRAEAALQSTDDYLNRGNIQSAYGRIARRQGRYGHALECLAAAVEEYRAGGGGQLQLARALLNASIVERLLALRLQKELDHRAASRRSAASEAEPDFPTAAGRGPGPQAARASLPAADRLGLSAALELPTAAGRGPAPQGARELRLRIEQIRAEARTRLEEAREIYERRQNHRGIAGVHMNRGFLCLDAGDLDKAGAEAAAAFQHGEGKRDYIVMARARTLQCMVEMAALEEQLGDAAHHHETAMAFARDAVAFAGHTQNRRLRARALVWQGLTLAAEAYGDSDGARRCCEQAIELLKTEAVERQSAWDDLESLKAKVFETGPVDPILRAWTAGVVENRTFRQLTEDFARLVIPKVWEREGRKVSRVADKLSISPKKVRRILHVAGLHVGTRGHRSNP